MTYTIKPDNGQSRVYSFTRTAGEQRIIQELASACSVRNLALLGRRFQERSEDDPANRHQTSVARISQEPVRSISPIRKTRSNPIVHIVILLTALMFCGALIISLAFVL